jgi:hypothetical protein
MSGPKNEKGPAPTGPSKSLTTNQPPQFSAKSTAGEAHGYLRGHSQALQLLEAIRADLAHPDALARAVEALASQPEALRGFCRTVQKHIEAGMRPGPGAAESGRGS